MVLSMRVTRTTWLALVTVLISLELASWLALTLLERRWQSVEAISARYGIDHTALAREMEEIYYVRARYHPSRWYALPANYHGTYARTDAYGFRIDRNPALAGKEKIGLFGGSTMFSTTTRQEGTIAHALSRLVDSGRVGVMNYGMGGYSTSAELPTLIEAMRIDRGIRVAVFYDGVNEVGRYLELLQDQREEAFYPVIGYPFDKTLRVALDNESGGSWLPYQPKALVLADFIRSYIHKMIGLRKLAEKGTARDIEAVAHRVTELYVANVQAIEAIARANDITPVFLWQPDIFLTNKKLTDREMALRDGRQEMLKALTQAVHRQVVADDRLKRMAFFDISDVLDGLEGEHFFDYCHVSEEANAAIAARMVVVLRETAAADVVLPGSGNFEN